MNQGVQGKCIATPTRTAPFQRKNEGGTRTHDTLLTRQSALPTAAQHVYYTTCYIHGSHLTSFSQGKHSADGAMCIADSTCVLQWLQELHGHSRNIPISRVRSSTPCVGGARDSSYSTVQCYRLAHWDSEIHHLILIHKLWGSWIRNR